MNRLLNPVRTFSDNLASTTNVAKGAALVGQSIQVISTKAVLKALAGSASRRLYLMGYTTDNDGGEGIFAWDATSSATDDGGTIINPTGNVGNGRWLRQYAGEGLPEWFGAKHDGVTDDQAAITSALNACLFIKLWKNATYLVNSLANANAALITPSNSWIKGQNATIKMGTALNTDKIGILVSDTTWIVGVSNVTIEDLFIDGNRANRSGGSHAGINLFVSSGGNHLFRNVRSINSPSDGFEVGGDTTFTSGLADNVKMEDCTSDNAYRNGLSVAGTRAFRCVNGTFSNTTGASPQAGVDCEPNGATSPNVDFEFVNTRTTGNVGDGFLVANSATGQSGRIIGLVSTGNTLYGYESTTTILNDVQLIGFNGSSNGSGNFNGSFAFDFAQQLTVKARVTFDGTVANPIVGTGSINVASITKNATGDYTITLSSAAPDANYVVSGSCSPVSGSPTTFVQRNGVPNTTTAFRIQCQNAIAAGTAVDPTFVSLVAL